MFDFTFTTQDLEVIILITFGSLSGAFVQWALSPILLNGKWTQMTRERKRSQVLSGFIASYVAGLSMFAATPDASVPAKLLSMVIAGYWGVAAIEFIKGRLEKS
jgi:hypothetical protein